MKGKLPKLLLLDLQRKTRRFLEGEKKVKDQDTKTGQKKRKR